MEDFFFNPTRNTFGVMDVRKSTPSARASMASVRRSTHRSPAMSSSDVFDFQAGKSTPERCITMRSYAEEPSFWRGYLSDEEVASPIGTDDWSSRTSSEHGSPGRESFEDFPEQLAQSHYSVEQRCNKAQVVKLVSVGKPRMVSMPRLIDLPPTAPRLRRVAPLPPLTPDAYVQRTQTAAAASSSPRQRSSRSSMERPMTASAAASFSGHLKEGESARLHPSVPHILTQAKKAVSESVTRQPSHDFLEYDPCPSSSPVTPPPRSPSHRRLFKLSPSFSLHRLGSGLKRRDASEFGIAEEPEPRPEAVQDVAATLAQPLKVVPTPTPRPKLVPRGANERAPLLVLPSCPDDYDCDLAPMQWPLRKELDTRNKLQRRQRSRSAALVTAQA